MTASAPPGWPRAVPPPGTDSWVRRAVGWLLDLCPPDYRGYPVLQRHPTALARLAAHHVAAQLDAQRRATATARADLAGLLPAPAVEEVLQMLDVEQARLLDAARGVHLVEAAMQGRRYVPRL